MLDPDQLRIFLVAAETLNFSKAAKRLHLSQPSVTQHIQQLETHFKTPLFLRLGRKLDLTETGQALVPMARRLVALTIQTDEMIDALSNEIHGNLVIACSTTPGKYILPVLLADFMRMHPRVHARCEIHAREQALDLLEQGKVHLALSNSLEELNQNIEFSRFITDPVVLITPLNHPWAARGEINAAELLAERFIMREETSGTYRAVLAGLAGHGINLRNLQTILTLGNSEAIAISVQREVGVGFVSQMVVRHVVDGKVACVRVRDLEISQSIYLCRHRLNLFGNLQAAFWDFAAANAQQHEER